MRRTGSTASKNKRFPALKVRTYSTNNAGDFQPLDVGSYTGHKRGVKPSGVACPYCHLEMIEAIPTEPSHRIVRIVRPLRSFNAGSRRALVTGHQIPDTHKVVACKPCIAVFTMPKALESALSTNAVDPVAEVIREEHAREDL